MNEAQTLTAEDRAWFNQEVQVQVQPDNRKWLDSLLEMKRKELIDFAIYRYSVPESAISDSSTRQDIIQLVVMANAAGGGGSVLRHRFRYLPKIANIPQYTQKVRGGRYLYKTRGEGSSMQVWDKSRNEWVLVRQQPQELKDAAQANVTINEGNTEGGSGVEPDTTTDRSSAILAGLELVEPALDKMNRPQLAAVVRNLGIDDTSEEKFPTNNDLKKFVRDVIAELRGETAQ